ncbi:MAG: hypothetical protein L6R42_004716 [Xanthoria sp. 1 TBL-2021]|nr:MAG: hypothetical protein L6R42_004716 [Xanthoria sp. 1 TBL-2021]
MSYVSTPPVSSPPFSFDSHNGFHIYDKDRHQVYKRCEPKKLHDLLTYDEEAAKYTKAGKLRKNPPRHTDETQHFYVAQLTHYGLKPTKSKQAAKSTLLAAYDSEEGLLVPKHILRLEKDLESEFRAKQAVLLEKKKIKEEKQREQDEKQRQKRKRDEDTLLAEVEEASKSSLSRKKQKGKPKQLDIHKISGTYTIVAKQVPDGWNCQGPLKLKLAPSSTARHLRGSFDFGVFEGKMRSSTKPKDSIIRFHWRGRETGEGESTYGPENVATLEFLPNGIFKGRMYWDCLGEFDLQGKLEAGSSEDGDLEGGVEDWKHEYWSINDANYERERVGRWGGWAGDSDDDEVESNSDTE